MIRSHLDDSNKMKRSIDHQTNRLMWKSEILFVFFLMKIENKENIFSTYLVHELDSEPINLFEARKNNGINMITFHG